MTWSQEDRDRIGEIIGRGMELAEAGMNLGLTIISTVGTAAQQKLAVPPGTAQTGVPPGAQPAAASDQEGPPGYGITNRLPLAPGRPVSISFSVNNDSVSAPKEVALHVEGFAGDRPDAALPVGSLRVVGRDATSAIPWSGSASSDFRTHTSFVRGAASGAVRTVASPPTSGR